MNDGEWAWSREYRQVCRIVERQSLWGKARALVWLPQEERTLPVLAETLLPLKEAPGLSPAEIAYRCAAAKISAALTQNILLAPIEAEIIPLPHQIRALQRAISGDHVRYLLADEVGLGKTIEAGLILRELKLRGRVRRTLVITPKGLIAQWILEMRSRFGERFHLLSPGGNGADLTGDADENIWRRYDQVICPMDAVKPLERRRGWTKEQVQEINRRRFESLVDAGWDLIIVDEAHRLAGSTPGVARHHLGQGLAGAAPYLLLLSATPHQGKSDAFHRLVSLLDEQAFPDLESVTRQRVQPFVIRTEKRQAIDPDGQPLFQPRQTRRVPVAWQARHRAQRLLYTAVSEYVRHGYNQALQEKRNYIGFLMTLMQRLVTSSTRAIHVALERRLEVLRSPEEQLSLFPILDIEEWAELDSQEQMDWLARARLTGMTNEKTEVELLLEAARRAETQELDAKAEALLEWIYRLQQEETDPELKILIFTEFLPTQEMLAEFLEARGFPVVCLNGSMSLEERQRAQQDFSGPARVMVSTEAGGEGLNLQFCHVVINYDIPWNPMRLEQRIGRVDRIGQKHPVTALNFLLEETIEYRVQEVLEEKLQVILEEFGVDKTGDVLDSAFAQALFDDLYTSVILDPASLEEKATAVLQQVQEQARSGFESTRLLGTAEPLDPALAQQALQSPVPHWTEQMVLAYLKANGGRAEKVGDTWNLIWPDGQIEQNIVFTSQSAQQSPSSRLLTLESPNLRKLVHRLPPFVPGQAVPTVKLRTLPAELSGEWSLWRVTLAGSMKRLQDIFPLFISQDGRVFLPTAWAVWEHLLAGEIDLLGSLSETESQAVYQRSQEAAVKQGQQVFDQLLQSYRAELENERKKWEYTYTARRKAIERVGLQTVHDHRLKALESENQARLQDLGRDEAVLPELVCLLLLRVTSK